MRLKGCWRTLATKRKRKKDKGEEEKEKMKIKSEKARLKAIERRANILEKKAKDDPAGKWAKEKLDESFAEDECANAYAMFIDMLLHTYPFDRDPFAPENVENVGTAVGEKYGFEWAEVGIISDIANELLDKFSDYFEKLREEDQ